TTSFGCSGAPGHLVCQTEVPGHDIAFEEISLRSGKAAVLSVQSVEPSRGWTGFIVIIYEVNLVRASVRGAVFPVVNDIVPQIEAAGIFIFRFTEPTRQTPVSTGTIRQEVMMEAANVSTDTGCVAVLGARWILLVPRLIQSFGNQRVLQCDILCASRTKGF